MDYSGPHLSVSGLQHAYRMRENTYIAAMKSKLPIKSLVLMNCSVAALVGGFLFLFELFFDALNQSVGLITVSVIGHFLAIGFINIAILKVVYASGMDSKSISKRVRWYLIGYILSCTFFAIPSPIKFIPASSHGLKLVFETIVRGFCVNSLTIFFQTFILVQFEKSLALLEVAELKLANMEAAVLLLKQQVQPHFLFNALSVLKTLYKKDVQAGETYLMHLASFLRVSVSYSNKNVTKLSEEIDFSMGYLNMQQVRFGSGLKCRVDIPKEVLETGYVPSFSIQPLVENAIKHNEVTPESPLNIDIVLDDDSIVVKNNLQKKDLGDFHSGHGLNNLIERYRIISGDEVVIRSDEHTFSVAIKILRS